MTTPAPYTEALERALGRVIADMSNRFDCYKAQADAVMMGLQARLVETEVRCSALETEARRMIDDRLANVRDGADGRHGETGERGEQGPPGERGERGEDGIQGPEGPPGSQGEPGAAGEQGAVGDTGATGMPGERGADGLSGPQGERGEQGQAGQRGEMGPTGERGSDGVDGLPGERGERGEQGPDGERGERGMPGGPGADGAKGETGERGPEGPQGRLPTVKVWVDRVHYDGEVVTHRGSTWQAARDTGRQPPHSDWVCLSARGDDGRSVDIRGTYDETVEYRYLDIVALNGGSFVALSDSPGPCPGEGWQLLASAGKRGQKGEDGARGERGERGERGLAGPAPIAFTVDERAATLTLTLDNGSEFVADLYPLLLQVSK